jgi:O-antigen/teichoic acid export membrane protein
LPFAAIAGLQTINSQTNILVLGLFHSAKDVGIYQVAMQASVVLAFGLEAVNMVAAPQFARLHGQRDIRRLQKMATSSARASLLLAGMGFLALAILAPALFEFLFGREFSAGYAALMILCVGQLVNVGMGSVGMLLAMTGHERVVTKGVAASAALNIVLSGILVPAYGMEGAALAATISLVVLNIALWRVVRIKLGIDSSVF